MEGSSWKSDPLGLQWTDWPYALVQLHEDTHHVPLPKEGHLGILPQRGAEMDCCRKNEPARSLPTPHFWLASCLPNRVEWMQRTHYYLPTRVPWPMA